MRIIASLTEIIQAYASEECSCILKTIPLTFHHVAPWSRTSHLAAAAKPRRSAKASASCAIAYHRRHHQDAGSGWERDHQLTNSSYIHVYIYIVYIHYMYAYIVLVDPFLGFTNFEPAICLAGWSRIASIKPLNKPRPVLHSLRKNSKKNTCLCTTTFFTPMLPLHSAVIYIAMETVQTFALLFEISQRRYDEVRFFGSQNPSNLEPRHLAVLQIGIECNNLSLDAVLIIFLIHTGYL